MIEVRSPLQGTVVPVPVAAGGWIPGRAVELFTSYALAVNLHLAGGRRSGRWKP